MTPLPPPFQCLTHTHSNDTALLPSLHCIHTHTHMIHLHTPHSPADTHLWYTFNPPPPPHCWHTHDTHSYPTPRSTADILMIHLHPPPHPHCWHTYDTPSPPPPPHCWHTWFTFTPLTPLLTHTHLWYTFTPPPPLHFTADTHLWSTFTPPPPFTPLLSHPYDTPSPPPPHCWHIYNTPSHPTADTQWLCWEIKKSLTLQPSNWTSFVLFYWFLVIFLVRSVNLVYQEFLVGNEAVTHWLFRVFWCVDLFMTPLPPPKT